MSVLVEVHDLKKLSKPLLKELKRYSFGYDGWMVPCMTQILRGYKKIWSYDPALFESTFKKEPLAYSEASAVIARTPSGDIMGWALVRHPQKRTAVKKYDWNPATYRTEWTGKFYYAGRRSDFMVYVRNKYRRQGVARALLVVTYNNFGRVDVYPHDNWSEAFYEKNSKFVTRHHTDNLASGEYKAREVA